MKRTLSLILTALLLASSFTACGKTEPDETTGGTTAVESNVPATNPAETNAPATDPVETDTPAPSYSTDRLTENGMANAHIVLADSADTNEKLAAEELQYHIKKVSGADISIVNTPASDSIPVYIGTPDSIPELAELFPEDIAWLTTLEEDEKRWGDDGFAIRQTKDALYIFGATTRGALNGVYDFIEENLGVLWVRADEEIGLIYDAMPTVTVTATDYREKSPFQVRGWTADDMGQYEKSIVSEIKFSRNKLNHAYTMLGKEARWASLEDIGLEPVVTCHNIKAWVLRSPIYDPNCTEYWNIAADGTPLSPEQSPQVNFLSNLTADTIAASIIAELDRVSPTVDIRFIAVCCEDAYGNHSFLNYSEPFEYAPSQFVESGDRAYLSTIFFTFLNKIARQVGEKYPNVTVGTYAYDFTQPAPLCDLEDNVGITFCPIESDMTDPLTDTTNNRNALVYRDIVEWKNKTSNVIFYNYYGSFLPSIHYCRPVWDRIQADLQLYASLGYQGVLSEGLIDIDSPHIWANGNWAKYTDMTYIREDGTVFTNGDTWAMNALPFWLYEKLSWDPYADVDALIREFCDKCYGDASPYMQEYYRILEGAWMEGKETDAPTPTMRVEVIWTTSLETYIDSFVDNYDLVEFENAYDLMLDALDKAWEAADDKAKALILPIRENTRSYLPE